MPVEANRIKGKLRELFPKVNLSTKRLDELSARLAKKAADDADDTVIAQLVTDANDFMPFADIAKEDDRIRTLEANQKKPDPTDPPSDPQPPSDPKPPTPPQDDVPSWAKALLDEVKELKQGKIIETKTQAARAEFDKNDIFKSIPEKGREFYFKQIDVNSETPIAEQIKNLEETHVEITQSKADTTGFAGKPPVSFSNGTADKAMIDKIVGK